MLPGLNVTLTDKSFLLKFLCGACFFRDRLLVPSPSKIDSLPVKKNSSASTIELFPVAFSPLSRKFLPSSSNSKSGTPLKAWMLMVLIVGCIPNSSYECDKDSFF